MSTTTQNITSIQMGATYFIVTDKSKGGRCVLSGGLPAVWSTKKEAKVAADAMVADGFLPGGFAVLKQIKD